MARKCICLRLVKVGDGLDVRGAVPVLDEEALVVLQAVGRPNHGVVEPIGVEVLEGLADALLEVCRRDELQDRKSTRLNSSHLVISYAVFCLKKKKKQQITRRR